MINSLKLKIIKKTLIIPFFFINQIVLFSQSLPKDLKGTIKINDTSFIPYKVSLLKNQLNEVEGFSITDENGPHETKSYIKGTFNEKEKLLEFEEYDIVYSKSPYDEIDFCFIHFKGKMNKFHKAKRILGTFAGKYDTGLSCIDGEIILIDEQILFQTVQRFKKKLDKPKFRKRLEKLKPQIDTIQLKPITTDEDLNVFVQSKNLIVSIYDSGKIDDDRIDLYIDDELILEDYSIEKNKKEIPLKIKGKRTSIKVIALNEGSSSPNTVKVEVRSGKDFISTKTSLKTNESATLSLIKK